MDNTSHTGSLSPRSRDQDAFFDLLARTEHSERITDQTYVEWWAALPLVEEGVVAYLAAHNVELHAYLQGMLTDALDLADTANEMAFNAHRINMACQAPMGSNLPAGEPVYLFYDVAQLLARLREQSIVRFSLFKITGIQLGDMHVLPLPHGLIFWYHGKGHLDRLFAAGDCCGSADAQSRHTTHTRTQLELRHGLLALLESWRLGYGLSRRHLCDLLRSALATQASAQSI